MRYVSDDGEVFNTVQECVRHEKRYHEEERTRKERQETERKSRLKVINQKYEELQKLVYEYGRDYETEIYFTPFCELAGILG